MRTLPLLSLVVLSVAAACAEEAPSAGSPEFAEAIQEVEIPDQFAAGQAAFQENCSACHGTRALGSDQGPPLIDIIYEPSHHADISFFMAVDRGVRAHHWRFGDMPALPHVTNEEVEEIVAYVRFLQRQVGIQ